MGHRQGGGVLGVTITLIKIIVVDTKGNAQVIHRLGN